MSEIATAIVKTHAKRSARDLIEIFSITLLAALILKTFVIDAVHIPSPSMESTLLNGDYVFVNKLIYGAKTPRHVPFLQSEFPIFHLPKLRSVARGDVIVFELPEYANEGAQQGNVLFVKRCIARSGDAVEIRHGNIVVNGDIVQSRNDPAQSSSSENWGPVVVPQRGAVLNLTQQNYSAWQPLIRNEGHTIDRTTSGIFVDGKPTSMYTVDRDYLFVLGDNHDHSYDSRSWGFLSEENVIGKATMVYWSADQNGGIRWGRIGRLVQ